MKDHKDKEAIRKKRSFGASLEIDLPEGDRITHLWSTNDGLLVVSERRVCRIRSPDSLDPELTLEDAPWQQSILFEAGTKNPLVARTAVQVEQFLDASLPKSDKRRAAIFDATFRTMNSLLNLERTLRRIEDETDKRVDLVSSNLAQHTQGHSPRPIPPIATLEIDFKSFVPEVRQCLNHITGLFEPTLGKAIEPGRYDKARRALKEQFGEEVVVYKMLEGDASWIELWIDLANSVKHPQPNEFATVNDMVLLPNRQIRLPTWQLRHKKYDLDRPQALIDPFRVCITNLLGLFENLFVCLIEAILPAVPPGFQWVIESKEEKDRNPKAPVRYQLSVGSYQ